MVSRFTSLSLSPGYSSEAESPFSSTYPSIQESTLILYNPGMLKWKGTVMSFDSPLAKAPPLPLPEIPQVSVCNTDSMPVPVIATLSIAHCSPSPGQ